MGVHVDHRTVANTARHEIARQPDRRLLRVGGVARDGPPVAAVTTEMRSQRTSSAVGFRRAPGEEWELMMSKLMKWSACFATFLLMLVPERAVKAQTRNLEIYWIDVEGGG